VEDERRRRSGALRQRHEEVTKYKDICIVSNPPPSSRFDQEKTKKKIFPVIMGISTEAKAFILVISAGLCTAIGAGE
jgi:hypothetical protein